MRKVATEVLSGIHGDGEERRKWLEENGYDADIINAMAGQLADGRYNWLEDDTLVDWMDQWWKANGLSEQHGAQSFAEYIASGAAKVGNASGDVGDTVDLLEEADDLLEAMKNDIEAVYDSADDMEGGDAFRGGLLNLLNGIVRFKEMLDKAFENVFGDAEERGNRLKHLLNVFYRFTKYIQLSDDAMVGLRKITETVLSVFKIFGTIGGGALKILANAFLGLKGVLDDVLAAIGRGDFSLTTFLESVNKHIKEIIPSGNKLRTGIRNIGKSILALAPSEDQILGFISDVKTGAPKALETIKKFFAVENLKKYIPSITKVKNIYQQFVGYLDKNYPKITAWLRNLKQTTILGTAFDKLTTIFNKFWSAVGKINFNMDGLNSVFEVLSNVASSIINTLFDNPEELKEKIKTFLSTIYKALKEQFDKMTFADVFKAVKLSAILIFLAQIGGVLRSFKKVGQEIQGIPQSISYMFSSVGDTLQAYRKNIQANTFIKIAAAIGILAGAMWVLSTIPEDKLTHVATTLAMVVLALSFFATRMQGIVQIFGADGDKLKINIFNGLAAKLVGFALAIISVVLLLNTVKNVDTTTLVITFLGIFTLMGVIGLVLREMSKLEFSNSSAVILSILALAVAIQLITIPVAIMAALPFDRYLQGVLGAIGLMIAVGGLLLVFSLFDSIGSTENILKTAGSMAIIAIAVGLLTGPVTALAAIPADLFGKAFAALLGIMAVLALVGAAMAAIGSIEGSDKAIKIAAALLIVSFAIDVLIPAITAFTSIIIAFATTIPWENMTERMEAFHAALLPFAELAIILVGFGVAMMFIGIGAAALGAGVLSGAAGVLVFSLALLVLSNTLNTLATAFPAFIQGLSEAGAMITAESAWNIIKGAVAFGLLAVAIVGLAKGLSVLFSNGDIASKITAFAGNILTGIGTLFKKIGSKIVEILPTLLQILGTLILLVGLYLTGIIPEMTDIIVRSIITLFESIYNSVKANKGALEHSIFGIVATALEILLDSGTWVMTMIRSLINTAITALLEWIAEKIEGIPVIGKKAAEALRDIADDLPDNEELMKQWTDQREINSDFVEQFIPPAETFKSSAEETSAAIGDANSEISAKLEELRQTTSGVGELFTDEEAADAAASAEQTGFSISQNLGAGLLSGSEGGLLDSVGSLKDDLFSADFLGGFSLDSLTIGTDMDTALGSGLLSNSEGGILDSIGSLKESFLGADYFGGFSTETFDIGTLTSQEFGAGLLSGETNVLSNATTIGTDVTGVFDGIDMSGSGWNALAGFDSGLVDYWNNGSIQSNLSTIADSVISTLNSGLGEQSPSKYTRKSGQYLLEGLRLGMQDNEGSTISEVVGFSSLLIDAITTAMARVGMLANEEFDISPRITPVVDMSNISAAKGTLGNAFGGVYGVSAQMSGSINARLKDVERLASSMEGAGQTINNNGDSFTFNIYAAEGMDEDAIADAVMNRMQTRMVRRGVAFG